MRRLLFFIIVGLGGAAVLISLGIWQVQRLAWKQDVIAQINSRITASPVSLPDTPDAVRDAYLPVEVSGTMRPDFLRVLVSQKQLGAGYRIIGALDRPEGGAILVDLGFVEVEHTDIVTPSDPLTITGNLQWPQETDKFTPEPDFDDNIWFARDVPVMADALGTLPLLVVARAVSPADPVITPFPVQTAAIPNDHLQYAITWFSLAAVWLAMSTYFLRRRAGPSES